MDNHPPHPIKGLIIWVDMPFDLPEYEDSQASLRLQQWQSEAQSLPDIPWDLTSFPVFPVLSLDPSSRLENALPNAEVWTAPQPTLTLSHYTVLKLAGNLAQQDGLWMDWDSVLSSHRDPGKRYMLDVSSYCADRGIVFILVPNPDDNFLRLWQYYLSHIVYGASVVYAVGPSDFDWPLPARWLADSVEGVLAQLEDINTTGNPEIVGPVINLETFIGPYGDEEMHEALLPGNRHPEEVPRISGEIEREDTTLRLDTAVPENVYVGDIFDLAVAVRQIISPILQEQDLTRTQSGDVQVVWPEGQDTIHLRIEINAPTCDILGETQVKFRLRYGEDSPVFYFQLSPKRLGSLSIIVKVYQEDYWLGSARVRTQVTNEVVGTVETTVSSHKLALTHTDLEIRVGGYSQDIAGYKVEALVSDGSHFDDGVLVMDESLIPTLSNPMDYGGYLSEMLFTGPIYDAYRAATSIAETATEGRLRVRLWIDADAPSLHAIVWERLLDNLNIPAKPITITAKQPFSRYIGVNQSVPEPIQQTPLRMLFVISNPPDLNGLAALNVQAEINGLLDALEGQPNVRITIIAGKNVVPQDVQSRMDAAGYIFINEYASLENIIRTLTEGEHFHILHILAHGRFVQLRGTSDLYLQDNDGFTKIVGDGDIVLRLSAVSPLPHLVFLASCESARHHPGSQNAFVGLAGKLVGCGVPAVVAMQDMLPIDVAQKLTGDFYMYLLQHGVVDRALAQARLLLFDPSSSSWSVPVLYMRLKDGLLFDL